MRKWYLCINEKGFKSSVEMIRAAVNSARANTDLVPHCVYSGEDASHISELENMGIKVIRHRSTFEDDLRFAYGKEYDTFSGHWLRIDLPVLEEEDEYILYTDNDVIFLAPPEDIKPNLIAAAPEFDQKKLTYFSSGVLVMNVNGMREVRAPFLEQIKSRLRGDFRYPAHDQQSFNKFFYGSYDHLPLTMNWKPFWGISDDARIVHFHGPKPLHARMLANGGGDRFMPIYKELWQKSPEAYAKYSDLYDEYKNKN
ncbi:hypothetical protein [Pararhizobium gei]|uniref:hypothetical protein n=1 Tax=Pararhizobium gei TaxID=1395951 RepID=UPI0023DC0DA1|nr:hypothetical protein [Rhizobium gei]